MPNNRLHRVREARSGGKIHDKLRGGTSRRVSRDVRQQERNNGRRACNARGNTRTDQSLDASDKTFPASNRSVLHMCGSCHVALRGIASHSTNGQINVGRHSADIVDRKLNYLSLRPIQIEHKSEDIRIMGRTTGLSVPSARIGKSEMEMNLWAGFGSAHP